MKTEKNVLVKKTQRLTAVFPVFRPDPVGSGFKLPGWIRIRIQNPDPESEIEL